jgi:penicillin-binding protein 2
MKTGFAFGEHIRTEKIKKRSYDDKPREMRMRGFLMPVILILVAIILVYELFSLQIIHGDDYRKKSDVNRMRTSIIHAPRGIVFDRNGVPLILNVPGFRQIVKKGSENKSVVLDKEKALALIAKGEKNIEVNSLRQYPYKESLAHVLGYIGQISKNELNAHVSDQYQVTDWIGKGGIEQSYERLLRGKDGRQLIEVDAFGKKVRVLGQTDPVPGQDITLTIDSVLQQAVYQAAKTIVKGAVIVSKPDGEILAMLSKPSYDANLFTLDNTYTASSDSAYTTRQEVLLDSHNQPLLNRAIAGQYPPGSTFKIITAAAGLENNIIDERYTVVDTGVLKIDEFSFANWFYTQYGKKEPGALNVVRALARSNDIFFYKLAEKVGVDRLSAMAKKFGLGEKSGIDLGEEDPGLVPTKEWKKKVLNENWYLGDTYHYGIGQGYLLTTPLQVNAWTDVIANGGTVYQQHLLKEKSEAKSQKIIGEKSIPFIRQGMIESCSTGGVAFPFFDFKVKNENLKIDGKNFLKVASSSADMRNVPVACKTGTAQHGSEETNSHAWITLFAPAYNPEVVVTVLVESGGEGSSVAAPIAEKVLKAYFEKRK